MEAISFFRWEYYMCTTESETPQPEVLEICRNAIRKHLGMLDDLPRELANTVANVYYRYFVLSCDTVIRSQGNHNWLPKCKSGDEPLSEVMSSFFKDVAQFKTDIESVPGFIEGLRRIDKARQPKLYRFTVKFILDCLKYNIPKASEKTLLRRMLERKLRKKKVKDIPNLIDFLNACSHSEHRS